MGLQSLWAYYADSRSRFEVDCLGPFLVTLVCYVAFNLPFVLIDLIGCPKVLLKYKVQPTQNVPITLGDIRKIIGPILFNSFVVGFAGILVGYSVRKWLECPTKSDEFPTVLGFLRDFAIMGLVEEAGFYYAHRILHSPSLYKRVHKRHHEWQAPFSMVSVYCHWFEHLFSNIGPLVLATIVSRTHSSVVYLWYLNALLTTTFHHSGYSFPGFLNSSFHDYHHLKFNKNFGVIGLLDYIHGTGKESKILKGQ